jgi:hypothetical protein
MGKGERSGHRLSPSEGAALAAPLFDWYGFQLPGDQDHLPLHVPDDRPDQGSSLTRSANSRRCLVTNTANTRNQYDDGSVGFEAIAYSFSAASVGVPTYGWKGWVQPVLVIYGGQPANRLGLSSYSSLFNSSDGEARPQTPGGSTEGFDRAQPGVLPKSLSWGIRAF